MRIARSRVSGENLFRVLLITKAPSHKLEPPENPGRFKGPFCQYAKVRLSRHPHKGLSLWDG
jgi:hypothetical protein